MDRIKQYTATGRQSEMTANWLEGFVGVTGGVSLLLAFIGWHPSGYYVVKAYIRRVIA